MLTLNALKVIDVILTMLIYVQGVNLPRTYTCAVGSPHNAELGAEGAEAEALVLCGRLECVELLDLIRDLSIVRQGFAVQVVLAVEMEGGAEPSRLDTIRLPQRSDGRLGTLDVAATHKLWPLP